jgi:tRNA(Ile)-lysidine synthase
VQQQFLNHIDQHSLCKTTDKILLAVSGGIDSMVMLDLFKKSGFTIGVVHCNFQLRGEDADGDEQLVHDACSRSGLPFYTRRFSTEQYAVDQGLSIQMAARQLRYDFFAGIIREQNYHVVATAHNLNDVFETTLLNLTKGTGIEGLTGIPVRNGKIIRPLLFADRKKIETYAHENAIRWREDSSNASNDYQRNFIRNKVIPSLREINPNLEGTFGQTLERILAASSLTKKYIDDFKTQHVSLIRGEFDIRMSAIRNEVFPAVILWELIKDFGFNFRQCKDIVADHSPGRKFISPDFDLTIDREYYIIHGRKDREIPEVLIAAAQAFAANGCEQLIIDTTHPKEDMTKTDGVAFLDAQKLSFPLRWRKWRHGDVFQPLGMSGEKKISDFLIDRKVPLHEKEGVTVVESNGKIVWVVGFRISDAFKITEKTKQVLVIRSEKTGDKKIS